jgi:YbgC/YbaW family acyl-CoA thioester hydrolase
MDNRRMTDTATALQRKDFRFTERHRVRWAEVDMQQIVFNAHYLMYFDTAVAGYWRAMAMPYHETMQAMQGDLYARKATIEYESSARYDDLVHTGVRCARVGNSSMLLQCAVFRDDQRLVHGELVYVFADPATQTSKPVPVPLREWLGAFDRGEPMVDLRRGDWATLGGFAAPIRRAVFTQEQGIDAALDDDGADADALHVVAFNRIGAPLGTGRLAQHATGVGKVGRMAVVAALRGSSVGRQLLDALVTAARQRGDRYVMLHAQASAVGFYQRLGWQPQGAAFLQAGIEHWEMVLPLS